MSRNLIARLHNPHDSVCACDPYCFCNRTMIGRAIKWRISPRLLSLIGVRHKNSRLTDWKQGELRVWKRQQDQG